jgi:hypothetical protein
MTTAYLPVTAATDPTAQLMLLVVRAGGIVRDLSRRLVYRKMFARRTMATEMPRRRHLALLHHSLN